MTGTFCIRDLMYNLPFNQPYRAGDYTNIYNVGDFNFDNQ